MATLIKTDGSAVELKPANGDVFTLEEMQRHVGGYIEILGLPSGLALVVDEDGKPKRKPRNNRATPIALTAGIAAVDFVVGDVLLCTRREAGYNDG